MYQGKYQVPRRSKRGTAKKLSALSLSLLLLAVFAVGVTVAYLVAHAGPVTNTFTPASVSCAVNEDFNGTTKSNVNVTNTGNTSAYIRVKLVTYRVNEAGDHIGGTATIPTFTLGTNWVKYITNGDVYYYYILPVNTGEKPANDLIGEAGIQLLSYTDADGGKQAIEVMAEAIQALGTDTDGNTPTQLAWGVTISEGTVSAYPAG